MRLDTWLRYFGPREGCTVASGRTKVVDSVMRIKADVVLSLFICQNVGGDP